MIQTEMSGRVAGDFIEKLASIGSNTGTKITCQVGVPNRVVVKISFEHEASEDLFKHSLSAGMLQAFKSLFPAMEK